jgi:hypothetical protein
VHSSDREDVVKASAVLLNRLPPEFAVVLAKEMMTLHPAFSRQDAYKIFMKTHAKLIAS